MNKELEQLMRVVKPLGIVLMVVCTISQLYQFIHKSDYQARDDARRIIQQQYEQLNLLPGAQLRKFHMDDTGKRIYVSLRCEYDATKTWPEVREFYTERAIENGWQQIKSSEDKAEYKDILFAKGKYRMACSYKEKKNEYSITIRWASDETKIGIGPSLD